MPQPNEMERLVLETKFTADDAGAIEGVAWDFSSPDRVGDMIEPTAFSGIVGKTIPALFAHDQSQVVGVFDQITVEADGLHVKGRLLVDTVERAREVRSMIQAKAVQGLSIGFLTRKAAPRKGGGRTIQQLDLLETSIVAVPAHPNARITSQKELSMPANAELKTEEKKNVETEKKADAVNDNVDTKALDAIQKRLDTIEAKSQRPAATVAKKDEDYEAKALNSWLKTGSVDAELKTLVVGTTTAGGYTVAPEYSANVLKKIVEYNPIRQLASVMSIGTSKVYIPTLATDAAVSWVSETGSRSKVEPTFGQVEIDVYEQSCCIPVSRQLLEDSMIDLSAFLADRMSVKFAESEATAFLTGTGTGEPSGILDNVSIAETDETSKILEDIISLFYGLKSGYAVRGSWLMSRATMGLIRKAADASTTRSGIWADSLANGQPATLLGRPVYEASGLDTWGSTSSGRLPSVLFGDVASAYQIVDRVPGIDILKDEYTSVATGVVNFWARRRVGGSIVQPEAIVALNAA